MRKLYFVFSAVLFLIGFTSFSQSNIKIEEFTLDNGLKVFLNENHSIPEVFGVVMIKAGSKNDPADATGLAHYQEHMLFKGTQEIGTTDWQKEKVHIDKIFELYDELGKTKDEEERKKIQNQINEQTLLAGEYAIPNELDKVLKSIGGKDMNAGTSMDYTLYYNAFPPNQTEKWLELYSHRFINPVFRLFQSELEVVYEEKNLYNDIFFTGILEAFQKNFFKKHPYGQQTTIGTVEHLKNPSLSKMYEFFKTYYVPNNMALAISGDFNTEEIIPLIKEKFGRLEKGNVPEMPKYEEAEFNGREFVSAKMSPIKIGIFGYRSPAVNQSDELFMKIAHRILSNQSQTGLFDKLTLDNKLLAAQIFAMPYVDHGATIILAIPKILGQSLEEAEKLIMDELKKLKNGEFDEQMVENIKLELLKDYKKSLETNEERAVTIASLFAQGTSLDEFHKTPDKINAVTKNDIVKVANQYFGDNFLAFYSKMGFPKKEKLEKPEYKPVAPKKDASSTYFNKFANAPTKEITPKYVDFKSDFKELAIAENVQLYTVKNNFNDVFNITLRFGKGSFENPRLNYAAQIMNFAGVDGKTVNEYKSEFSKLGSSFSVWCDDSYVYVSADGFDRNLKPTLELLKPLFVSPKIEENKLGIITNAEASSRKMERSEPDNIAQALFDFIRFENHSSFLHRLSLKEIKNLKIDTLVSDFKDACKYDLEIHYSGNADENELTDLLNDFIGFNRKFVKGKSPIALEPKEYNENLIYFVNKKNALQSKIYLFVNGEKFVKEKEPYIQAFNQYFSGDFSGLVLQEIREYRSLAYGAGAAYKIPNKANKKSSFYGYVGTQDDKTMEAIEVFTGLIKNMPEKADRMENVKRFLIQSAYTSYPSFRELTEVVSAWKDKGYNSDPNEFLASKINAMDFNDIVDFYKKNIQPKPIVYSIVGDKKRIDLKELEKYGKIIYLKEDKLFN
jgi:zinc protease